MRRAFPWSNADLKWIAVGVGTSLACLASSFLLTAVEIFECCFASVPHPDSNLTLLLFYILFLVGVIGLLLSCALVIVTLFSLGRRDRRKGWVLLASVLPLLMFGLAIVICTNGIRSVEVSNERAQAFYGAAARDRAAATAQAPFARITSARYGPGAKKILTVSDNGTARVWDAETGQQLLILGGRRLQPGTFRRDCEVQGATFSEDGSQILSAECAWDAETGRKTKDLVGKVRWVSSTARLSPDGRWIVTAQGRFAYVWDAATGRELIHELEISKNGLTQIKFSGDSKRLIAAGPSDVVRIWDVSTGTQLSAVGPVDSECAAFNPDSSRIATGGFDKVIRVFDASTGQELRVMNEKQAGNVTDLAFSPNGGQIVSIGGTNVYVWDSESGRQILKWDAGINTWSAEYSPDGDRIVTAHDGGIALVWDAATGQQRLALRTR